MKSIPFIDFGLDKDGQDWQTINDGVMGGLSDGIRLLQEESLLFKGNISLENNGGFSSLKSPYANYDLSDFSKLEIRFKTAKVGEQFSFTFECFEQWYRPYFKLPFKSTSTDWETQTLDLSSAEAYEVGRKMGIYLSDDIKPAIIRLGFIKDDKKTGDFELEVDYIKFLP